MTVQTEQTKVHLMIDAIGKLSVEYAQEGNAKVSKTLHQMMTELPPVSLARLFDIIETRVKPNV